MIDTYEFEVLFAAILCWIIHLISCGMILRATHQRYLLPIMAGTAGFAIGIGYHLFGNIQYPWHWLFLSLSSFVFNVFLYGAVAKSLSIGMLTNLASSKENQLTEDELGEEITMPAFLDRVDLICRNGWVAAGSGGYVMTKAGQARAGLILKTKEILRIENTGFYR